MIATEAPARKSFSSISATFLPFDIAEWRRDTIGLTPAAKGSLVELRVIAAERGGSIPNDDGFIARALSITKAAWLKIKPALIHTLQIVGDLIVFPGLISHLDRLLSKREKTSESLRAYHEKITPRMGSKKDARKTKKDSKIKESVEVEPELNDGSNVVKDNKESSLRSDSESSLRSDSCHSQARDEPEDNPFAGLEPDPSRAGAGSSKSAGAGCEKPNPQPAESQQEAPDGAGPSQKIPRKRVSRAIDPNWCPKPETQAWARNGKIGATDIQIAEQLEEFIRHFEANGKPMKDWDKAFQNWMSRAKKWGQLDAPRKTWQERKLEEMSL